MEIQAFFQSLKDALLDRSTVSSVYGEPITVGAKKVVPVARVVCGFGGGVAMSKFKRNTHPDQPNLHREQPNLHPEQPKLHRDQPNLHPEQPNLHSEQPNIGGEGGGGGGGFVAIPVGMVEITPETTRFIRLDGTRRLLAAAAVGTAFGLLLGWRERWLARKANRTR